MNNLAFIVADQHIGITPLLTAEMAESLAVCNDGLATDICRGLDAAKIRWHAHNIQGCGQIAAQRCDDIRNLLADHPEMSATSAKRLGSELTLMQQFKTIFFDLGAELHDLAQAEHSDPAA